jgi:hypothetical protein
MRLATRLAAAFACMTALARCVILTGDTSGYSQTSPSPKPAFACLSAADCDGGPDAGPAICCVAVSGAGVPTSSCQTTPVCPAPTVGVEPLQLCKSKAECANGGCVAQTCYWQNVKVEGVHACGVSPGCMRVTSDSGSEAGQADAGGSE